jgi:DNA processing protein
LDERTYWLAWSHLPRTGTNLLRRLQQRFGSLENAWTASPEELASVEGIGPQILEGIVAGRTTLDPQQHRETLESRNPILLTPLDPDYPSLLREIPSPPATLFASGRLELLQNSGNRAIALVGTRNPSDYGRRWTRRLAQRLAEAGFLIVSGLAEGIDTDAHCAALDEGADTIAVLGTGVDLAYPRGNLNLHRAIAQKGLLLSEYPAGTEPARHQFPARNRIIVGLSRAVIVTEAPSRSGALITAHLANDYCREVYVLPGNLENPRAIGCLGLISQGAQVILSEGHLLESLGQLPCLDPEPPVTEAIAMPELPVNLAQVFQWVPTEPVGLDWLVQSSGLPTAQVSSALTQLEILSLVEQLPGMLYQRCLG